MFDRSGSSFLRTILRIVFGGLLVSAFVIFVLWRTENPRLQAARSAIIDTVSPTLESIAGPSTALVRLFDDIETYSDLQAENVRLRRQVQRLTAWREVAQQLEEENARLRALNAVKLPPRMSFVTAEVIADAGGPFSQSILVNLGRQDGVVDGAPALDALGLVGRVVGAGDQSARILLLTDPNSRTPVLVGDTRRRAILQGDNSDMPQLRFILTAEGVEVGERVITSGQGGVFPAGFLVGRVRSVDGAAPMVRLAADYRRLEFVRVRRQDGTPLQAPEGGLILRPTDLTTGSAAE